MTAPVVQHLAEDLLLGMLPGTNWLFFASDRRGRLDLWAVPVRKGKADGQPVLVKQGLGRFYPLGFANDGRYYHATLSPTDEVYLADLDRDTGWITGEARKFTSRWPSARFHRPPGLLDELRGVGDREPPGGVEGAGAACAQEDPMNPLGPPDSYLADVLMSTLVYSVATVSALVLLEVIVYVAMLVDLLRGNRATRFPGAAASAPQGTPRDDRARRPLRHPWSVRTSA